MDIVPCSTELVQIDTRTFIAVMVHRRQDIRPPPEPLIGCLDPDLTGLHWVRNWSGQPRPRIRRDTRCHRPLLLGRRLAAPLRSSSTARGGTGPLLARAGPENPPDHTRGQTSRRDPAGPQATRKRCHAGSRATGGSDTTGNDTSFPSLRFRSNLSHRWSTAERWL
jgi:hypothetical protein